MYFPRNKSQTILALLYTLIDRVAPDLNVDGTPNGLNRQLHDQLIDMFVGVAPTLAAPGADALALQAWTALEEGSPTTRLAAAYDAIKTHVVLVSDKVQSLRSMRAAERRQAEDLTVLLEGLLRLTANYPFELQGSQGKCVKAHLAKVFEQTNAVETVLNETLGRMRRLDVAIERELSQ